MATLIKETALTFSDVLIVPQYSKIASRSDVDTVSDMEYFLLSIPVISANMRDISDVKMCVELAKLGAMGILHRFMTIDENVNAFSDVLTKLDEIKDQMNCVSSPLRQVGVSVGVKKEEIDRFRELYHNGAKIFCLDVAHGHHDNVRLMLEKMREIANDSVYIIAGNVATGKGAKDLVKWGANCIKVGIGPGAVCETRKNAGVGVPQLSALMDVKYAIEELDNPKIKIISDGGIKATGDIPKALAFADAVMIGSMISGTSETPGNVYKNDEGKYYKTYGGSASGENKVKSKMDQKFVEGMVKTVPFKGHVKFIIREIHDGTRSAFSYTGVNNFKDFQKNVILRVISGGGKAESKI